MLKKLINLMTFTDLPVRQKFLLFSVGSVFWLGVVSVIGLITTFDVSKRSKEMVEVIVPQEKAGNILIRKLRGASISAHKIAIYNDKEVISNNYLNGKARLEDCRSNLDTLLNGGKIKDYSRGTGQLYGEFSVMPIKDAAKKRNIEEAITKIEQLKIILDEMAELKYKDKKIALLDKLSEYDALTRETVTVINDYIIGAEREWADFTKRITAKLADAFTYLSFIFGTAILLSVFFSILIARSLEKPINAIIQQIKALSAGEIDLTKKLDVTSKDELGLLSKEFNNLMDTISHVTSFKKIIEEDESIEDVYMRLGKIFRDDLKLDKCVIYEVSNSKNMMKIVYPPEAEGIEMHCKFDIQINSDLCRAKRTGHLVSSIEYPDICKYYSEEKDEAYVCIPIIIGGSVGGVVQFVCGELRTCNVQEVDNKISRARQYITEAQPVLEAKRLMTTLKESSLKDALTGLYNRRFIEESSENIVSGVLRRGTIVGILMCDLDFFKQTNDMYGHDVGDMVLKEAANCIKTSIRGSDFVIRFGGEEFMALLMDIKPEDALVVAEKIRQRIEETKVRFPGGVIQKTISIGVSEFPTDTQNFWEAIKFADVALYKAKEMGRNRVLRFTMDMWTEEKY